ncbi:pentapeptide repeat-containing protein [Pelagibacterium nitratireducens]|uniref:Pentapeptide repeat-containing protein n=1 Tax=Pelagibacterium nitratireducens TaxID=1046114 RepID=A0ABZ2HV53_9HYPH
MPDADRLERMRRNIRSMPAESPGRIRRLFRWIRSPGGRDTIAVLELVGFPFVAITLVLTLLQSFATNESLAEQRRLGGYQILASDGVSTDGIAHAITAVAEPGLAIYDIEFPCFIEPQQMEAERTCGSVLNWTLAGEGLSHVAIYGSRLWGADFMAAAIDRVIFRGVDFSDSALREGAFTNNAVFSSDMRRFNFENVDLEGSYFLDVDMRDAAFESGAFGSFTIENSDMSGASIWGGSFEELTLRNVDLSGLKFCLLSTCEIDFGAIKLDKVYYRDGSPPVGLENTPIDPSEIYVCPPFTFDFGPGCKAG